MISDQMISCTDFLAIFSQTTPEIPRTVVEIMGSVTLDSGVLRLGTGPGYGTISAISNVSGSAEETFHGSRVPGGPPPTAADVGSSSPDPVKSGPTTPPLSTLIPFPRDRDFVNRPKLLARIDEQCSSPGGRAALVGLGGTGKSQLAVQYAYRARDATSPSGSGGSWVSWILADEGPEDAAKSVFWVQAGTLAQVEDGFRAIAQTVGIQDHHSAGLGVIQLVCRWLGDEHGKTRWLVVFDGADSADVFFSDRIGAANKTLAELLPSCSRGSFLFTTSDRRLASRLTLTPQAIVDVGPMALEEAILLLERKMGAPYGRLGAKADLVEELELIPLAITRAAIFIRSKRHLTPETYLQRLRESDDVKTALLNTVDGDGNHELNPQNSAVQTWQAELLRIRAAQPSAADLLCLMSCFDNRDIPTELLRLSDTDIVPDGKSSISMTRTDEDLAMLRSHCLISNSIHGGSEMLHLVQLSIKAWLIKNGQMERFLDELVSRLNNAFSKFSGKDDDSVLSARLIPHAEKAAAYRPDGVEAQLAWASLLHKSALHLLQQGRLYGAEQHAAMSTRQLVALRGVTHEDTLEAKGTLLEALKHLQPRPGLFPLAVDTATSILGGRHGTQDLQRYQSIVDIATMYLEQGQPREAEALCEAERAILKHRLGDDHADTLRVSAMLGSVFIAMERLIEAENLLARTLDACQQTLGKDDTATLVCMEELATACARQGKLRKAELSFLHVIETRTKLQGATDRATLTAIRRMASEILWSGGHGAEAQEMLTRAMRLHEEALGEEDDDTATCMYDLAGVLMAHGQYAQSEKLLRKAIEIRKKVRGQGHLMTLTSMSDLAGMYKVQQRWEEAGEVLPEVIEGKRQLLGEEHGDTTADMRVLAEVYMAQGLWNEAELLLAKVIDGQTELLGANHEDTVASEELFYRVMRKQGRPEENVECKSDIRACSQR